MVVQTLNASHAMGVDPTDSLTLNIMIRSGSERVKDVAAAALEVIHCENPDVDFLQQGSEEPRPRRDVQRWLFFPGVVGNNCNDVHQAIHCDMKMGISMPSYYEACQGQPIPAKHSLESGWVVHLPLCKQGMRVRVRVLLPNAQRQKFAMR